MMLTSVPPALIHHVRDAAAIVHDLAQLGLDLLCPCEDGHGERLRKLAGEDEHVRVHRFVSGVTCWCGAEHWRALAGPPGIPPERLAGYARLERSA